MKPINNMYKVEGKQVLWWNGVKWLVKETCKNNREALKLLAVLEV
jgi:hypothetical protein